MKKLLLILALFISTLVSAQKLNVIYKSDSVRYYPEKNESFIMKKIKSEVTFLSNKDIKVKFGERTRNFQLIKELDEVVDHSTGQIVHVFSAISENQAVLFFIRNKQQVLYSVSIADTISLLIILIN